MLIVHVFICASFPYHQLGCNLHSFFRKLAQGLGPSLVILIMGALGYDGELKANQPFEVAEKMKWLVAALYTFSAIVMFVSITFIYNLDKKKVAVMTEALNERRGVATETVEEEKTVEATQEIETPETLEETAEEISENTNTEE